MYKYVFIYLPMWWSPQDAKAGPCAQIFIHLTNSRWAPTTCPRSQQWNITLYFFTGNLERIKKILSLVKNLKSYLPEFRRSGWQRMRWSESITHSVDMSLEIVIDKEAWHAAVQGAQSQTWLSMWTTTKPKSRYLTEIFNIHQMPKDSSLSFANSSEER